MNNELVVKDNILINASYNLELTEQRLILLSIVRARDTGQGITADSKLQIHAGDYMYHYKVDRHAAYKALKEAALNLFERQFSFKEEHENTGKIGVVKSRWVSRIKYIDELAILEVTFSPDVVPLITRLEKHFTSYQLKQVSQLTSKYAIRLYEILIAWREVGKTPVINLSDFRMQLGLEPTEYTAMNNFKKRVLEPAITQINTYTDIDANYEQFKDGRIISGIKFTFKEKLNHQGLSVNKDKNTVDMFTGLTEKQLSFFAKKLAYDDVFASSYAEVGETYSDLEKRLLLRLTNLDFIETNAHHLKRLGLSL
ncbi:replication initiation protein RepM [Acinetobacter boissieri]|uniref:Initiator Replication protein n=1 Tax=Acinetobacter boissieri TaxID=1219383 RepID=A0A1G6JQP1_9GAMM|nr:replication initiation protein RepM [Acinetobacter boissieri]SDC20296.1 Initiator Replication protein [Acinetobacter boissieri]